MKKYLLTICALLFSAHHAWAIVDVWQSSHTATVDAVQPLCVQKGNISRRGVFHGVCVNDSPAAAGTISIYNSSSTAVNPVAVLRATSTITSGCQFYDVYMSSGISYATTGANDTTIMYDCY